MESIVGLLLLLPGVFLLLAASIIYNGWALHLLWLWFMVPIFNLPVLSVAQAIAVAMVIAFTTFQYVESPKETKENSWISALILLTVRPLFCLGVGLVLRNYI